MDDTPGVSTVHVWAYPNPGSGTVPIFLGAATYGLDRPDVQAAFGERTRNSGFTLTARGLSAGNYQVVAFAYSTVTNSFNQVRVAIVTVVPDARVIIDAPAAGRLTLPVRLAGWAADLSATDDTGIDAVHVWAYPADGSAPQFLGAANYGESRPDVAAAFRNPALTPSGYSLTLDGLAAGRYQLVVFAHRIGAIEFDAVKTLDLEIIGR
jgi:hypothetical protein